MAALLLKKTCVNFAIIGPKIYVAIEGEAKGRLGPVQVDWLLCFSLIVSLATESCWIVNRCKLSLSASKASVVASLPQWLFTTSNLHH